MYGTALTKEVSEESPPLSTSCWGCTCSRASCSVPPSPVLRCLTLIANCAVKCGFLRPLRHHVDIRNTHGMTVAMSRHAAWGPQTAPFLVGGWRWGWRFNKSRAFVIRAPSTLKWLEETRLLGQWILWYLFLKSTFTDGLYLMPHCLISKYCIFSALLTDLNNYYYI